MLGIRSTTATRHLVTACLILAIVAAADVAALHQATKFAGIAEHRGIQEGDRRAIIAPFTAPPGSHVSIPSAEQIPLGATAATELFVVEGGEGTKVARGGQPAHVYVHIPTATHRQQPFFGVEFSVSVFSDGAPPSGALEAVYVLHLDAVAADRRAAAEAAFDVQPGDIAVPWGNKFPTYVEGWWYSVDAASIAAAGLAFLYAIVASISWFRGRPEKPLPEAGATELFADLARRVSAYLRGLRRASLIVTALTVLMSLLGVVALSYWMDDSIGPSPYPGWGNVVILAAFAAAAGLIAASAIVSLRVHREIVRLRDLAPPDLG